MQAIDLSLPVRQAVVAHLKSRTVLTSLVAVASIHGEKPKSEPEKPFIKLGYQAPTPWMATGLSGMGSSFSIDAYSRGRFTDEIYRIGRAVVDAMQDFSSPEFDLRDLQWTGTNYLPDGDDSHAVIGYNLIATVTELG